MLTKFIFKAIDLLFDVPQNVFHDKNVDCILSDAVYDNSAPDTCLLDIYSLKENEDKLCPVFINLHGGGFVAGDKKYRRGFSRYVASLGYKVINVNYGLCPEYTFPTFIEHAIRAICWCEIHSKRYGLDMDRAIISGDSAGGYVAQCVCISSCSNYYRTSLSLSAFDTILKGAALFSTPHIPSKAFAQKLPVNLTAKLWADITGNEYHKDFDITQYKYYKFIDCGNFMTSSFPPTFITHSDKDEFCAGHGIEFAAILRDNGVKVTDVHSLTDTHDWHEEMLTYDSRLALDVFEKFIDTIAKGETVPDYTVTIDRGQII